MKESRIVFKERNMVVRFWVLIWLGMFFSGFLNKCLQDQIENVGVSIIFKILCFLAFVIIEQTSGANRTPCGSSFLFTWMLVSIYFFILRITNFMRLHLFLLITFAVSKVKHFNQKIQAVFLVQGTFFFQLIDFELYIIFKE